MALYVSTVLACAKEKEAPIARSPFPSIIAELVRFQLFPVQLMLGDDAPGDAVI